MVFKQQEKKRDFCGNVQGTDTYTLSLSLSFVYRWLLGGKGVDESYSEFGSAGLEHATSDYRSRHLAILEISLFFFFFSKINNYQLGGHPTVTTSIGVYQLGLDGDFPAAGDGAVCSWETCIRGSALAEDNNGLLVCNIACCSERSRRFGLHIAVRKEPG
jgi:hypothetical protein